MTTTVTIKLTQVHEGKELKIQTPGSGEVTLKHEGDEVTTYTWGDNPIIIQEVASED